VRPSQAGPQALAELSSLFPEFGRWWNEEEVEDGLVDGVHLEPTPHHVMMEFLGFCAKRHASFSARQLDRLGEWIDAALGTGGELARAVRACFLANSHRAGIDPVLAPRLRRAS
jgi:hypothetical protein